MVIKHVCSSTLIKQNSPTPQTCNHIHVISHDTPAPLLLFFQMSCPTVTLITEHTLTVTITDIICCVFPSRWIFYFKSSIYNSQPTLHISHPHKTTYSQPCTFHTHTKQLTANPAHFTPTQNNLQPTLHISHPHRTTHSQPCTFHTLTKQLTANSAHFTPTQNNWK